ncbi:hypothetical protein BTO16_02205 [Polaribacter glomeratus]|uniref:Uncharacterized protein n=2 Tax=Polaribacter glomeratus TaxID=102 RepID=A0A2S7WVR3_9FLAO|nr:hypothetical protein BTO16_02205 [Polaribacter glomeratus]
MEYAEMTFLIIFISIATFIIMATPVALFYFTLDNYFKWRVTKKLINKDLCCKNNQSHSSYVTKVCEQYKTSFTKFIANASALIAWNIFSIIYISLYFSDFKTGVYTYFLSPFQVIESFNINYSIDTLSQFKTEGFYMFVIFMISLLFFQIGRYVALFLLKNNLLFSLKNKLLTNYNQLEATIIEA